MNDGNIIPYYEDNTRISNSSIGWFKNYGANYYNKKLNNQIEESSKSYFETGTMIHMYILEPDEFWKNYTILDFEAPKSDQQKKLCEIVAEDITNSIEISALNAYKELYSTAAKSDEKSLTEALKIADKYKEYIEYLRLGKQNKKVISFATLNKLKLIKESVTLHKKANELLFYYPTLPEYLTYSEFHINWSILELTDNVEIGCKSLIDRLLINHSKKEIILVDVKTTSNINNFKHSVEEFEYYRQIKFYLKAIEWYFNNVLNIDISEYSIKQYIVAISTVDSTVKVFEMNDELELENQNSIIINTISKIYWHEKNNLWEHDRCYYDGDGSEPLLVCKKE